MCKKLFIYQYVYRQKQCTTYDDIKKLIQKNEFFCKFTYLVVRKVGSNDTMSPNTL